MYRIIVGHESDDHKGRNYKISDEDWMHNHQNEETHEDLPSLSGRLPQEGDVKSQETTSRQ